MMSKTNYLTLLRAGVTAALAAAVAWLTYLSVLGLFGIDSPFLKVLAGFITGVALFIVAIPALSELVESLATKEKIYWGRILVSIFFMGTGVTVGLYFIADGQYTIGVASFFVVGAGADAIGVLNIIARCSGKTGLFTKE